MNERPSEPHWLVRPRTIRRLWQVFAGVLALTVLAQLLMPVKGYFGIDKLFAFGAVFGFVSCVAMVLIAKALGYFIKRDENYYREDGHDD